METAGPGQLMTVVLVPELQPVFGEVTSQLFEGFSDEDLASFTSLLRRMRENLQL